MPTGKKNQLISIILTIAVCLISLASAYILYKHSYISEQLWSDSTIELVVELVLLFFWLAGILTLIKQSSIKYISLLFVTMLYLWAHKQLDLLEANRCVLKYAGLSDNNIHIADICTCDNNKYLFSHRSVGERRGNLAAFLALC